MTMRFEQYLAPGIAQLSYLVGDDSAGVAAVIDPRPDVDIYLERARALGVSITHVFETHIHADFMSGARELAARLGPETEICVSEEGGAEYGFAHRGIRDGEAFAFGKNVVTARFTPGHTPEHLSFLIAEEKRADTPWGVVTGDSLFVDSAGRPDLLGEEQTEELVRQLHETLYDFYLGLDDSIIVYPCHGAGSACGANIGDRLSSTIGYERRHNRFLQSSSFNEFKDFVLGGAPPVPNHYTRLKKVNAEGPEVQGRGPLVPALRPDAFDEAMRREGVVAIDTREILAFGGGHIPGVLNIPARPMLSVWAGWLIDPKQRVLLVLDDESRLEEIVDLFVRVGVTRFAGYLAGGMNAWQKEGLPLGHVGQMSVHELHGSKADLQILDVRTEDEWDAGRIPGARHRFLPDLLESAGDLDGERPIVTYCGSGYRANIAASILAARGFRDVRSVPGSWQAWRNADLPVEKG